MSHRQMDSDTLVIASHNKGKVREIEELLQPFWIACISATDLNLPEPEETETTFEGNARLKAMAAAQASGRIALADDSGLAIDALDGAPRIYSPRWAGPTKDFSIAIVKVLQELDRAGAHALKDRTAHFACALCLAWPDQHTETFVGRVHGTVIEAPHGDKGFGYDPIFMPDGYDQTFGEMDQDRKHQISHRARAFQQMIDACFRRN